MFMYSLLGTALGYGGVVLVYAGFYLLAAVLTHRYLRIPANPGKHRRQFPPASTTSSAKEAKA